MSKPVNPVKKMAELLKSGATMLAETCPVEGCNLPLFKLPSGEIICPQHGKIYLVKTEEEARKVEEEVAVKTVLDELERTVLKTIYQYIESQTLSTHELIEWLEVLERIYRIKNLISGKK